MSIVSNKKKKCGKIGTYHAQEPFGMKEDFIAPKASQLHHIFREQKGLLQRRGNMTTYTPLKSLIDASSIKGSPLSMGAGSHAWGSRSWTSALSKSQLGTWLVFCCLAAL